MSRSSSARLCTESRLSSTTRMRQALRDVFRVGCCAGMAAGSLRGKPAPIDVTAQSRRPPRLRSGIATRPLRSQIDQLQLFSVVRELLAPGQLEVASGFFGVEPEGEVH